jgi:hypothetical protein
MRESKCPQCQHHSLYVMPAACKTICANCKVESPIVKLCKDINASSVKC